MIMMAFAGLLAARGSKFAKLWIMGSMFLYSRMSMSSFCRTDYQKVGCCTLIGLEALWMCFFKNRELKISMFVGKIINDMSRNAIFYYVIHLCFYRIIEMS